MCDLKPLLSSNYELYSVLKPGFTTDELKGGGGKKKSINQSITSSMMI